jgi:hypothetical protein
MYSTFQTGFVKCQKFFVPLLFILSLLKTIFLNNRRLRRSYRVSEIQLLLAIQIIPDTIPPPSFSRTVFLNAGSYFVPKKPMF